MTILQSNACLTIKPENRVIKMKDIIDTPANEFELDLEFLESGINELQLKYEELLEKYFLLIGGKHD